MLMILREMGTATLGVAHRRLRPERSVDVR